MPLDGLTPALRPRAQMEDHQTEMAAFIRRVPRCAVWAPMGSGKTGSVLTAVVDCIEDLDMHRILVIGPMRVAQKVWADEIEDWAHTSGLSFQFLDGAASSIERKITKLLPTTQIMAISCDKVHILAAIYLGRRVPWDTIIIDEVSRFKNAGAKRTKALKLITIHPQRIIELTGTPSPNGFKDLWSQIYMLDRGERLGRTMEEYKKRFFLTNAGTVGPAPSDTGKKRIMRSLQDIVYVLRPEDFKSVRKPLSNPIKLDLTSELLKKYNDFEREYILKLMEGGEITALNSAALQRKLLQFSSGAIYDSDGAPQHVHDLKLEALRELVEDNSETQILVAYNFRHEIQRIKEMFPHAELFGKDPSQQDRWNRREIPIMLVHPKSAGHGLNLQFGGHTLIWYSYDYNLEEHQQLNMRLPRPGQQSQVIIHYLIMRKTLDEIVMKALTRKDNVQSSFQDDFKKHIIEVMQQLGLRPQQRRAA